MFTGRRIIIFKIIAIIIVLILASSIVSHIVTPIVCEKRNQTADCHNWTENPEGEQIEMTLNLVAVVEDAVSEKELGYPKEGFMTSTYWWQASEGMSYEYIAERMGLSGEEYAYNFAEHYYIFAYGRPLKSLICDTTLLYYDNGYEPIFEHDMEIPYKSNTVYIYETEKYRLTDIEWIY